MNRLRVTVNHELGKFVGDYKFSGNQEPSQKLLVETADYLEKNLHAVKTLALTQADGVVLCLPENILKNSVVSLQIVYDDGLRFAGLRP